METLFEILRSRIVIGASILAFLIVVSSYVGSRWYYGDVEPIDIPENSTFAPVPPSAGAEVNLEGLQAESEQMPTESKAVPIIETKEESVDDFLAGLSEEEIALLAAEAVKENPPVSPLGFGPYPEVPSGYPDDPVWIAYPDYPDGSGDFGSDFMRDMELIDRVLIKLWTQGHRATSAVIDSNGIIHPGYPDTVYVTWDYVEEPDGTLTRYASQISSGPEVPLSVHDAISDEGAVPFGIKELSHEADGIDSYTFLGLN